MPPVLEVDMTEYGYRYAGVRKMPEGGRYVRAYHYVMPFTQLRPSSLFGAALSADTRDSGPGHFWVPMDDHTCMVWNFQYRFDTDESFTEEDRREYGNGNGPDHVDSHRSPAFLISPWVKHHAVDSSMYNTTSMLRTIEFLLGLKPMTHFDAGARPMTAAFQAQPDPAPYTAEKPRISLDEKNPAATAAAARAAHLKFEEADENDDDEMNDILWRAIRKDAPPPPVRSTSGT